MKFSIFSFLLVMLFAFSSCDKSEWGDDKKGKEDFKETWQDDEYDKEDKEECFELVYPVTFVLPDGSSITGNEEEVWTDLKVWYENNPDVEEEAQLQYPVEIIFKEEIAKTINNEEEMEWAKKACKGEKKGCFKLTYPVTYNLPDGSSVTGDEEEVWTAIKAWYEVNPDSEEKPALQYPVDIIHEDGTTETISTEEDMIDAKKACWDKEECFELVYPVTYTLPDGSAATGDDEKALWETIKAWYEVNPDSEEKPSLVYPVDIVFEDGSTQTIDDEAAMELVKTACEEGDDG